MHYAVVMTGAGEDPAARVVYTDYVRVMLAIEDNGVVDQNGDGRGIYDNLDEAEKVCAYFQAEWPNMDYGVFPAEHFAKIKKDGVEVYDEFNEYIYEEEDPSPEEGYW